MVDTVEDSESSDEEEKPTMAEPKERPTAIRRGRRGGARRAIRRQFSDDEKQSIIRTIQQKLKLGAKLDEECAIVGIHQSTYYNWIKKGLTPVDKPSVQANTPVAGKVMVEVDLDMFVRDNRERIIKRLLVGKPEHVKTAVMMFLTEKP